MGRYNVNISVDADVDVQEAFDDLSTSDKESFLIENLSLLSGRQLAKYMADNFSVEDTLSEFSQAEVDEYIEGIYPDGFPKK